MYAATSPKCRLFPSPLRTGITLLSLIVICAGCTPAKQASPRLENTGTPALHTLRSQQLRSVMNDLDTLFLEQLYTELEREHLQARYTVRIAEIIEDMGKAADGIQGMEAQLGLTSESMAVFQGLRSKLQQQADTLQRLAATENGEMMQPALEATIAVCNECHRQFRQWSEE